MSLSKAELRAHAVSALRKCYVIPVSRACNAACVFCATDVYAPRARREIMPLTGLSGRVRLLVAVGVDRFEVTGGGEPTLHPHLADVLAVLRAASPRQIKLYTNGSRLPPGALVDELNVSRCALESERNQRIMRMRGGSPNLLRLLHTARERGYRRVRVSVPLIRGGIQSLADAVAFTEAVSPHADGIVFRPLYPATRNRDEWRIETDAVTWSAALSAISGPCEVEIDTIGCFRAAQLILAADLGLYSDWSLTEELEVV